MNFFKKIVFFYERKIEPGFKIKRQDLVLDIGSGDKPFWRANVFLDNLSLKNLHRHTNSQTVTNIGTFINSDITKTPFKNKIFDFSFCSHLLEHVENPKYVVKEIERISKRGYIEVPNGIIEFIHPFHSHLWLILLSKKRLVFFRKSKKLHNSLLNNSKSNAEIIEKIKNPFIRLYWEKKIDFEIIDNLDPSEKYFPPVKTPKKLKDNRIHKLSNFLYLNLVKILRKLYNVNGNTSTQNILEKK